MMGLKSKKWGWGTDNMSPELELSITNSRIKSLEEEMKELRLELIEKKALKKTLEGLS